MVAGTRVRLGHDGRKGTIVKRGPHPLYAKHPLHEHRGEAVFVQWDRFKLSGPTAYFEDELICVN